ncbi:MAG: UTP--glucose-1-phosphate uridylyltransferase GalU [Hydrogenophaga sp.]|uniref:UTP--glucose-1-phosphate uridylyltransferase n=1 Tax=Hydrogenophaga crocea TaxID=2716225 RepID=A0A6G8IDB1_9BURK|nr:MULTISPECIES: UTP--glucose-1-phosphate uridylyltransferase GalU [Hydrogenophaga]MBL0945416.1 UTP--glucose-1-phosphate uridylyltransferase GalU [Hydrogenophaga sp.]QIM50990.1 UTP--glucose-1-phosphate uridylyltransferase GalU [Hydrogenophaga crocea]
MTIRKAVFPVGGLGTRFLPATKAIPKEMLPVVDKPLMQYAVEEAYAAGIREMIFVTGRNKRAIEDHFDVAYELETELEAAGKGALLELVTSIKPDDMDCFYVRQPRALGLGHAVLCAERLVGNEPFAVLLADDLMIGREQMSGGPTVLAQMVQAYAQSPGTVLAVQDVPRAETRRYGVVDVHGVNATLAEVFGMVEKPAPEKAPSTLAVAGRYILTPAVFESIRQQPRGAGGEIQLTDGIAALIGKERVQAFRYDGRRYDCGSKEGFLEATIDLALANPALSEAVRAHLQRVMA